MKNLFLVGSFNNWETLQQYRFKVLAGNPATLLADLPVGTHEFQIATNTDVSNERLGADGSETDIALNQLIFLTEGGANLSLRLDQSGIYFFSLDQSQDHLILRIQAKFTRSLQDETDSLSLGLDHFLKMKLPVTFEVGRASLKIEDALSLGQGSVVDLDRMVGDALNVYVGGKLVALGEVVMVNEQFAVRILEILPSEGYLFG